MLSAEQITYNWEVFLKNIKSHISGKRGEDLLAFYLKYEDRFALMPASGKTSYHNAFAGGYVDHVNRVLDFSFRFLNLWIEAEATTDFTKEELAFVAINHDLGKFGDLDHEEYIIQDSTWHSDRGEVYKHNPDISFMKTSERSLFLLQQIGVPVNQTEYLGIKLHDGLYEDANKPYYMAFSEDYRLRTNLPFVVHQADLLATRVEHDVSPALKDSPAKDAFRKSLKRELSTRGSKPKPEKDIRDTLPPPVPKPKNKYSAFLKKL